VYGSVNFFGSSSISSFDLESPPKRGQRKKRSETGAQGGEMGIRAPSQEESGASSLREWGEIIRQAEAPQVRWETQA
jgi:hypothetical protein